MCRVALGLIKGSSGCFDSAKKCGVVNLGYPSPTTSFLTCALVGLQAFIALRQAVLWSRCFSRCHRARNGGCEINLFCFSLSFSPSLSLSLSLAVFFLLFFWTALEPRHVLSVLALPLPRFYVCMHMNGMRCDCVNQGGKRGCRLLSYY